MQHDADDAALQHKRAMWAKRAEHYLERIAKDPQRKKMQAIMVMK